MAPDAKRADLLYVADNGTNDVYVYSYPRLVLKGTLTGFYSPGELCVDKAGDVFVPNAFASDVIEYAHGGTTPIAILHQPQNSFSEACAVDRTTGDLAVAVGGTGAQGRGPGELLIYRNAGGTPASYEAMYYPYSCGYDAKGNLFVDGEGSDFPSFEFGEFPKGRTKFKNIVLDQSIALPGGVQWDGKHVAVGDVYNSVIYQFAISGKLGTTVGSTQLAGTNRVWQFWIQGSKVIAPNPDWVSSQDFSNVLIYDYPAGGSALKTLTGSFNDPVGATISRAPSIPDLPKRLRTAPSGHSL